MPEPMSAAALQASGFFKALAHEGRLLILVLLAEGELSVTEIERKLGARQAATSQQLARLRIDGLVATRRVGKTIYYSIRDPNVHQAVLLVHALFGPKEDLRSESSGLSAQIGGQ